MKGFGWLKTVGKAVAKPVMVPVKKATQGGEKVMQAAILGVIRHVLTYVGGAMTFTGDDLTQFVGAATTLIGLFWSLWEKRKAGA